MRDNEQVIVNKNDIKRVKVAENMMNMLVVPAVKKGVFISRSSYERYQGASAITESIIESGLLPKGLSFKEDSEGKKAYFYQDAHGNYQQVVDVHSFFNDIAAESFDFGFNLDQMAVAFSCGYGYEGQIIGASKEGMIRSQMEAYYDLHAQKVKGASK